nr:hypothetical protein [Endozoicomonas sp.]
LIPLFLQMNSFDFKVEYSFFEVDKDRAESYADGLYECFWENRYKDVKLSFLLRNGSDVFVFDSNDNKGAGFEVLEVESLTFMGNDANGKSYLYSNFLDNKPSLYKLMLGNHNYCSRQLRINEIVRELEIFNFGDKITVCKEIQSGDNSKIQTMNYCSDILTNSHDKRKISFDQGQILVVGEYDSLKVLSGMISSPCSQWDEVYTICHHNWDIDNVNHAEVIVPCLGQGNISLEVQDNVVIAIPINHDAIPLTEEQSINHRLLSPPEAAPSYRMHFAGGIFCGAVSYLMDEVADKTVLRRCPKIRPIYQFGRNVLFGGFAFGSLQTAFSHVSNRWFSQEPRQCSAGSWQQSVIKFCMNNTLLLIPVTQGAVLPALCSMAGAMSAQVALQSLSQRLMTSEKAGQ